jgi:hypothetical protein
MPRNQPRPVSNIHTPQHTPSQMRARCCALDAGSLSDRRCSPEFDSTERQAHSPTAPPKASSTDTTQAGKGRRRRVVLAWALLIHHRRAAAPGSDRIHRRPNGYWIDHQKCCPADSNKAIGIDRGPSPTAHTRSTPMTHRWQRPHGIWMDRRCYHPSCV